MIKKKIHTYILQGAEKILTSGLSANGLKSLPSQLMSYIAALETSSAADPHSCLPEGSGS